MYYVTIPSVLSVIGTVDRIGKSCIFSGNISRIPALSFQESCPAMSIPGKHHSAGAGRKRAFSGKIVG